MTLRPRLLLASLAALVLGGASAHAQTPALQPRAVVELFTSQGCSSCPPADALFVELAKDPTVIALTMPVTYWDYLGWKDTLGHDAFTKRQKLYAKSRGDGQVYTPQAVINGGAHLVGSDKAGIDKSLRKQGAFSARVSLSEEGGMVRVALSPVDSAGSGAGSVWLLPTTRMITVPIGRGENQGKTISYANVVRGMVKVGDWDGKAATLTTPLASARAVDSDGYVVLVQSEQPGRYGMMPGAVIGAARSGP
jgi:hypothetical protein